MNDPETVAGARPFRGLPNGVRTEHLTQRMGSGSIHFP